ncbi:MAG: O-antigen ligase [Pseudohongiellaceae bacterium]|jgi:O-antigen ligase
MRSLKVNSFEERILTVIMIVIGLLPLLPNKLKPLPVVVIILATILLLFKKTTISNRQISIWIPMVLSSLVLIYAISLLYTDNMRIGLKRIETGTSLFVLPWAFYYLGNRIQWDGKHLKLLFHIYFWSSIFYAIMIVVFFWTLGYYQGEQTLEYSLSYLDGMLEGYSQHPIYASMIFAIALFFIPYIYDQYRGFKKVFLSLGVIILVYVLFLLFRKGVMIALILPAIVFIFKNRKAIGNTKLILLASVLITFSFFFKDKISIRLGEVFAKTSFEEVDIENSTSMRFAIYECVVEDIKQSPITGYGIGDGYDLIATCLKDKHNIVFKDSKQKKNAHNQYLGIWHYAGGLGLLLFMIQLLIYFVKAISSKNMLFVQLVLFFSILMLTENILDRQTGVLLFALFLNLFFFMHLAQPNPFLKVNKGNE